MVKIGKVLKPKGLKGTVKTEYYLEDKELLREVKNFFIDNNKFTLKELYFNSEFAFLTFNEVLNVEATEKLKFKDIYIEEKDLRRNENEYFASDLTGKKVLVFDGEDLENFDIKKCEYIGLLKDIEEYAKQDVFVIGKWELPNTENLFLGVINDKIILRKKRFKELSTYDED